MGALVVVAVAALAGVAASPAAAAPTRTLCPQAAALDATGTTSGTPHFLVHFTTTGPDATTTANVDQLKADLEAGYALEITNFGFPQPPSDIAVTPNGGDGRTDVYVYTDTGCPPPLGSGEPCGCNGFMATDSESSTGWIHVEIAAMLNKSTPAHEYFHTVQLGASPNALQPLLFREATAVWIGALVSNGDGGHPPLYLRSNGIGRTLDCSGCGNTELPYGQWPFFELENERIGPQFVKAVLTRSQTPPVNQLTWMNDVLNARGTSLGAAVLDYGATIDAADWSSPLLAGRFPLYQSNAVLGVVTNTSTNQTATLDHLATRYFQLTSNACAGTCDATLHLDVAWPGGSGVQASLVRLGGATGARIPITSGSTGAHADLPFNLGTQYAVSMTNPSIGADGVPVTLTANAERNAAAPSGGGTGTTTTPQPPPPQPPAISPVPTIQLTGKPKIGRKRTTRVLRLSLNSSGPGFVVVTLASPRTALRAHTAARASRFSRTLAVKQGANSFTVAIARSVRKGRYTVTLTPQSSGGEAGTPISAGKVSVPKPPKAKKRKRARYVV
jgi:hypothetical protein